MNNKIIHLFDNNFDTEVLKAKKPVLIDFWAEWCNPCKMIAPILENIVNDYSAKLIIGKLNVDHNTIVTARYAIRSVPTLAIFKNGELIKKQVGFLSKIKLKEFLDENI